MCFTVKCVCRLISDFVCVSLICAGAKVWDQLSSDAYWPGEQIGILDRIFYFLYSSKRRRNEIKVGIPQPHYCFTMDCNYTFTTSGIFYDITQRNRCSLMWILILWIFSPQGHSSFHPGQCWCFPGSQGHLFMSLFHQVSISHETLHISKSQSPNGDIWNALREFFFYYPKYVLRTCRCYLHSAQQKVQLISLCLVLLQWMRTTDEGGYYLGTVAYDQDGAAFQTPELPERCIFDSKHH